MSRILTGSCLCGRLKYRITGNLFMAAYCHCSMCRKAHGAAFRARALVYAKDFEWLCGVQDLSEFPPQPPVQQPCD